MKKEIENSLEKKYNEAFIVTDHFFDKGLNLYLFTASPKSNRDIVFEGNYDEREKEEKKKIDQDGYPNSKFSYAAGQYYESLFPNKELPHVASATVSANYKHEHGTSVPSWDEYLTNRQPGSTIKMNTYFFEVPDRMYHQTIVTLRAVLETLQEKYQNNFSLYAGFWPKGFLEGKKLDELTFGFDSTSDQDADNLLNTMQYLSKVIFIKIVNGSVESIDEARMFELMKEDNKNGMNEMTEI